MNCISKRPRSLLLAGLISLFSLGAAVQGFSQDNTAALQRERPEYSLGSGDRLRVIVFGHADLSGQFELDGAGTISLPLVGSVAIGGMRVSEAEATIVDALKPDYLKNPRVSLEVLNYRPFYIMGEVNSPGSYSYVHGMTVLEAVAIAGGYTHRAKESSMSITRASDPKRKKERASPESVVLPGDVIEVPQRYF